MNATTTPKKKPKSNTALVVAGVATAAVVGGAVYFLSGNASAKSGGSGSGGSGSGSGGSGGSGSGGSGSDGSAGPGGNIPDGSGGGSGGGRSNGGSSRPKGGGGGEGVTDGTRRANDPKGYWWGDKSKIPKDFDYQSNRIWISADRTAAAAGFYFFLDGINDKGERITWDDKGLSFMIADGTILEPTKDVDHRTDKVPSLKKILDTKNANTGDMTQSVFSWVGAYYGTALSPLEAATSRAIDITQDMVDEASVLSGGSRAPIDQDGPLKDFYGYALTRLDMGRKAIYGEGWPWGQGEDAVNA